MNQGPYVWPVCCAAGFLYSRCKGVVVVVVGAPPAIASSAFAFSFPSGETVAVVVAAVAATVLDSTTIAVADEPPSKRSLMLRIS